MTTSSIAQIALAAGLAAATTTDAVAQTPLRLAQPGVYYVTWVDFPPNQMAFGTSVLQDYVAQTHPQAGLIRLEVLKETTLPNHFIVIEIWRDQAAYDAHAVSPETIRFRESASLPRIGAPVRVRRASPVDASLMADGSPAAPAVDGPPSPAARAGRLHVVTHIDFLPWNALAGRRALLAYVAETRKQDGNVRVEASKEAVGSGFFVLDEIWRDEAAYEVHASAGPLLRLRHELQPLIGAPYDIRRGHPVEGR